MSTANAMVINVEVTGNSRSGTSKAGKEYCMYEGFVHMPNCPYPQKASFYAENKAQVPQPGMWQCDVLADVRDGRLEFQVDPRQGRRMVQAAKSTAA
jgi:hypothetical protein